MSNNHPHHKLYHDRRWLKRAAYQLKVSPLCEYCKKRGMIEPATCVDHVVPHRGDLNAFRLVVLQSLYYVCHNLVKLAEEQRGYHHEIGADGWPIDKRHPVNRAR